MHLNERHCAPCLCSCGVAISAALEGGTAGARHLPVSVHGEHQCIIVSTANLSLSHSPVTIAQNGDTPYLFS
jgi:hypothetical protein